MAKNKIVIANHKMNMLSSDINIYLKKIKEQINIENVIICPSCIYIPYFLKQNFKVGIQNIFYKSKGAYTGEISVKMLKSIKTDYVLLGHYERRLYFNETEEEINKKLILALKYNIKPIVCIGSNESLENEINMILKDIKKESINNIIFIYEPVFSIGTGNALDKNEIIDKIKLIKNIIFKKYDEEFNNLTLGYGGSINSNNIFDIVNNDEINAILVGSSSLNEKEFANIINLSS